MKLLISFSFSVLVFFSCKTEANEKLLISTDLERWPSPFFGQLISTDSGVQFLHYNKIESEIQLIKGRDEIINSFSYEFNKKVDVHYQTFYRQNIDSLFVFQKYLNDVILFNSEGIIKNHFWLPKRFLNHYSNFRNRPAYYNKKVYFTEIPSIENIDSNACKIKEVVIELSNKTTDSIMINLPTDIRCKKGLSAFQMLPLKLQNENKIYYLFPSSNHVIELNLDEYSAKEHKVDWDDLDQASPFEGSYTYSKGLSHYKRNEKSVHFAFNGLVEKYVVVREDRNRTYKAYILNADFQKIESFPLNKSLYYQSILPFKNGFVALSLDTEPSDSLSYFQNLKSFRPSQK